MTHMQPSRHRQVQCAGVLGRVKAATVQGWLSGLDSPCALPPFRSCRCRDMSAASDVEMVPYSEGR